MKISKIFHWLYAFLMFLPVFFVLGKGLYVTFNDNAKDSYSGNYEISYKYESNQVNSVNDLVNGNIYELQCFNALISEIVTQKNVLNFRLITSLQLDSYRLPLVDESLDGSINELSNNYILSFAHNDGFMYIYIYSSMYDFINSDYYISLDYTSIFLNNPIIQLIDDSFQYTSNYEYFHYTDYNEIESVNLTGTLDNALDYAMSQLNDTYMFSWAKDSFLSTPIVYITSLFNMPTDSAYITALCYWLNISIIWLTFDVIMYVPLLTHRWLDKGIKE